MFIKSGRKDYRTIVNKPTKVNQEEVKPENIKEESVVQEIQKEEPVIAPSHKRKKKIEFEEQDELAKLLADLKEQE